MTADAHFNRWMRRAALLFALIAGYIFYADLHFPMTPHSMVQRPVVTVAPRVGGEVIEVKVENNQLVEKGDVLFIIDPTDYEIAVEKARLALSEAQQANDELEAQLLQMDADILEEQVTLKENKRELNRLKSLVSKNLVSQQLVDQMAAQSQASQARLTSLQENKHVIEVRLGDEGDHNLRVRIAQNELKQAELNLARTQVQAVESGVVSNLQLVPGIQAQANQALMSLVVTGEERITADFREKSLSHLSDHALALVSFDAIPGKVFEGELASRDLGVQDGQLLADGRLAEPDTSDRWVRDAQRVRVYVELKDHELPENLVTGARATVLLVNENSNFVQWFCTLQMKVVSLLHYVY